ncbi:MAG: siroheme synthase CysG [Gammaproteobacteria bacterium]|nr:siroheme synthase CysG [Gammaproteobacteria bacterium]
MRHFPVFLDLNRRRCLVVGGGEVAAGKVQQLLRSNADILVVAPRVGEEILALEQQGKLTREARAFMPDDVVGCALAIAATADKEVNVRVAEAAKADNVPVNVVDNPALCSFIMPSVVDRDPVQIAVSTGGASPVLARLLRVKLETLIPASYGRLATVVREFRGRVKQRFPEFRQRRRFWENILQGPVVEMLFAGREAAAVQALENELDNAEPTDLRSGEVYLVGGGPGDPDLLTFRALRLMQQADVVLYDRLVAPAIVELVRKEAKRIYVGKRSDSHTVPQSELNALLVELAQQGKRVLRLKGGDPFIFGRGGEEIEELAAAGVPFQVVPGITAAAGCASYAGIPLTHRDYAHSCLFVTGHLKDGKLAFNWPALLQPKQTLAIYMGVKGIDVLQKNLLQHGMRPDMPAAVIQQGTTPNQKVYAGTVSTLAKTVADQEVKPPSMIVIGEVVKLHEKLTWFQK